MPSLYLATSAQLPRLAPDDAPLVPALEALGLRPEIAVWDDPHVNWGQADLCVIRTTWDYHLKRGAFLDWARQVARETTLLNPLPLIAWNTQKTYLRDLAAQGIPTIPTEWLAQGDRLDLGALLAKRGWEDAVIKPVISASAHRTMRVNRSNLAEAQGHLDDLLQEQGALVQPYMATVEGYGERALVFIEGQFSHAVRKTPVLAGTGGDPEAVDPVDASAEELALAAALVATIQPVPLYARVDLIRGETGFLLMEFELVEPSLYLPLSPSGTARLAEAIARRLAPAKAEAT